MPIKVVMLMINICIYNHPSKHFARENFRAWLYPHVRLWHKVWLTLEKHYASMVREVLQE